MTTILAIIIAYCAGSIPCGLLLGRLAGVDVRAGGSGNIGATNVTRQLGKAFGLLTLAGDMAKAVAPMWLAARIAGPDGPVILAGLAAVTGHCFPLYLRFRGGKGVATALGVWLYLYPPAALLLVAVFFVTVAATGYVSAGSLASAALLPIVLAVFAAPRNMILAGVAIAMLVWLKHRDNIARLLAGTEQSWRSSGKAAAEEAGKVDERT